MSNNMAAQKILEEIKYATIATVNDTGEPWNTPVFYATNGHTIYWASHRDSIHSKNIASSGKAFIVIYNSKAGAGEGTGLYIKALASILTDKDEIADALRLLGERRGRPFLHIEKFMNDSPRCIYTARPLQLWTNDARKDSDGDFIKDFRVEVTRE